MTVVVVGASGAVKQARELAKRLRAGYSALETQPFPDNELRVRLKGDVKGKDVTFVQSFAGPVDDRIMETLLAANTAKEEGARSIALVALYFPYLRQDMSFRKGEAFSARIVARMFSLFDRILIVDPHLHRLGSLDAIFDNAERITAVKPMADYIRRKVKDPLFVGPDGESSQWAGKVAKLFDRKATILEKVRISGSSVRTRTSALDDGLKGRNVVIVDDIISTGNTMLKVVKRARSLGAAKVYCIATHGLFISGSLPRLSRFAHVATCNTISSPASKIDVIPEIASELKKARRARGKRG